MHHWLNFLGLWYENYKLNNECAIKVFKVIHMMEIFEIHIFIEIILFRVIFKVQIALTSYLNTIGYIIFKYNT